MTALLDEDGLGRVADEMGQGLLPGAVLWLQGELGAGKTTFARSLVRTLGVTGPVQSPTYALVHSYEGRRGRVFHVDCFRLRSPVEARDLDWETLLTGEALLIEWPERAGTWAPRPTHRIQLAHTPNPALRRLELA